MADSALKNLCAIFISPDMREYAATEKATGTTSLSLRIRACDATFSIGNRFLQLFGVLAIDSESGLAVPTV
jgi:hypothetical protein